ncbi:DNA-3-methyladenine glycosylase family protein [Rhizohabitans arisaemae]|uniref:DNA-3-methyladenine glycosylase family protein n=1 Tax=Rhizohabitans arisaemae TaxID=2720610 RepID=UPI0024B0D1BC|nr:DNA-3-methyladenine glycosylase 2 family protein [Rhizohabitans arisaemae]
MKERSWRERGPLDIPLTLSPHSHGGGDPVWRRTADGDFWRVCRTPDGPGTLRIRPRPAEGAVHGEAYGPGADWLLETMPALLGAEDDVTEFHDMLKRVVAVGGSGGPRHGLIREAAARHAGLRIGRTGRLFEALAPAILEQKVVGQEAWRAWRHLLRRYGEVAPGPAPEGMRVPPAPEVWRTIPSWEWHRAGAEAVRGRTIITAARVAAKLEAAGNRDADRLLRALPGIGVWTSAETRQRAHGDPDAVSVGDYHLSSLVGWVLIGRKVDDDGMLELLEPFRGQRYRVTRLIELTGLRPPARGPRMAPRDYRSI